MVVMVIVGMRGGGGGVGRWLVGLALFSLLLWLLVVCCHANQVVPHSN